MSMYKHILVATDGSELAARAVDSAVRLAQLANARLTGLYVIPTYVAPVVPVGALAAGVSIEDYVPRPEWEARVAGETRRILDAVRRAAEKAGVQAELMCAKGDEPWKTILDVAQRSACDCIVMASHGRRGIEGLLLGSETTKVLTHGTLPVLVVR